MLSKLPLQRGELGPVSPLSLSCGLSTEGEEAPGKVRSASCPQNSDERLAASHVVLSLGGQAREAARTPGLKKVQITQLGQPLWVEMTFLGFK